MLDFDIWMISTNVETVKSICFPLKRLCISGNKQETEAKLLLFLSKFTETLEELQLENRLPDFVYEMIFKKFIKLRTLQIQTDLMPTEDNFFQYLQPNLSVRKLIVNNWYMYKSMPLQGLIGKLPNIETLVVKNSEGGGRESPGFMAFISSHLRKLKNLELANASPKFFNGVNIPSLKSITITRLYLNDRLPNLGDCKTMICGMPNIEYFSVYSDSRHKTNPCSQQFMFRAISAGWTHLRHIKLREFQTRKEFYEVLIKCKKLKTVEIDRWAFNLTTPLDWKESILSVSKQNGLRFIIY